MIPVACLPLCGILMGIGYLLCPASMQGGEISGIGPLAGMLLVKAGGALIDHIALLFAVGVGVGMSDDQNGTAGITALVSWLVVTSLLEAGFVQTILHSIGARPASLLAFEKIQNPFIGILCGLIGAYCYNRFKNTSLPEWLAFFSRSRCTVIMSALVSLLATAALFFLWPVLFGALVKMGRRIEGLGALGAGLYAFLNRMLIPLGLAAFAVFYLTFRILIRHYHLQTPGSEEETETAAQESAEAAETPSARDEKGELVDGVDLAALLTARIKRSRKSATGFFDDLPTCVGPK